MSIPIAVLPEGTRVKVRRGKLPQDPARDIPELYLKLERTILPLFYGLPYAYATVMRNAIAVNGSFFNTQRMVLQYAQNAYGVATNRTTEETEAVVGD